MQLNFSESTNLLSALQEKRDEKSLLNVTAFSADDYVEYRMKKQALTNHFKTMQDETLELINLYNQPWVEETKLIIDKKEKTIEEQTLLDNPIVKIKNDLVSCDDPTFFEKLNAIRNKPFTIEPFIKSKEDFKNVFQNLSEFGQDVAFQYLLVK